MQAGGRRFEPDRLQGPVFRVWAVAGGWPCMCGDKSSAVGCGASRKAGTCLTVVCGVWICESGSGTPLGAQDGSVSRLRPGCRVLSVTWFPRVLSDPVSSRIPWFGVRGIRAGSCCRAQGFVCEYVNGECFVCRAFSAALAVERVWSTRRASGGCLGARRR